MLKSPRFVAFEANVRKCILNSAIRGWSHTCVAMQEYLGGSSKPTRVFTRNKSTKAYEVVVYIGECREWQFVQCTDFNSSIRSSQHTKWRGWEDTACQLRLQIRSDSPRMGQMSDF